MESQPRNSPVIHRAIVTLAFPCDLALIVTRTREKPMQTCGVYRALSGVTTQTLENAHELLPLQPLRDRWLRQGRITP